MQTRLVSTANKACLHAKEALFENATIRIAFFTRNGRKKRRCATRTNASPIQCQIYKQHWSLLCRFRSILWFPCHHKTHLGFGNLIVFPTPTIQFPLHRLRHHRQTTACLQRAEIIITIFQHVASLHSSHFFPIVHEIAKVNILMRHLQDYLARHVVHLIAGGAQVGIHTIEHAACGVYGKI